MTDQPPVADPTRRSPTSRVEDAARRRAATRWRIAIAVAVVALLAIGGFLLFGGDVPFDEGPSGPGAFSFELKGVKASAASKTPPAELRDTVREAGAGVKATMDELYFAAFVDSDSWGDYAAAYELFDGPAAERAEEDAEVLTLGTDAGDIFDALTPAASTLSVAILTDLKDVPSTAIAEVRFLANAEKQDGTSTQISSTGSFFLRQVDGAWRIFAYRVDRGDDEAGAATPSGSPS